ncbi:MAG: TlpA family protein disulfide reductase [Candidatus Omnitrophica bacterium]|nr:TlpA family protein disulfide reductase [Candidatus Omnitrophota bacterium]
MITRYSILLISLLALMAGCRQQIQSAPDFKLPTLADASQEVTLSEVLKEHPVLLVFWASWCPSCVAEIPTLNEWNDKYQAQGLKIFGVNFQETPETILEFSKQLPIRYPILLDRDGHVAEQFGLEGLPAAVLVAQNGKIIYFSFSLPHNMPELLHQGSLEKTI